MSMKALLSQCPVIPVMVIEDLEDAVPLAKALVAGGMTTLEITLRTDCALDAIERTLALEPRHYNAMSGLMLILIEADLKREALRIAHMIQTVHPNFEDIGNYVTRLESETRGRSL